jgi:hypothetical protein
MGTLPIFTAKKQAVSGKPLIPASFFHGTQLAPRESLNA